MQTYYAPVSSNRLRRYHSYPNHDYDPHLSTKYASMFRLKTLQLNRSLYSVSPASPTFATSVAGKYERWISSLSQRTSDDIILSAALQYSEDPSRSRLNSFTAKKTINNKPNHFYWQWLRSFALIATKSKKLPGNEYTPSSPYGKHFGNNLGVDCKRK